MAQTRNILNETKPTSKMNLSSRSRSMRCVPSYREKLPELGRGQRWWWTCPPRAAWEWCHRPPHNTHLQILGAHRAQTAEPAAGKPDHFNQSQKNEQHQTHQPFHATDWSDRIKQSPWPCICRRDRSGRAGGRAPGRSLRCGRARRSWQCLYPPAPATPPAASSGLSSLSKTRLSGREIGSEPGYTYVESNQTERSPDADVFSSDRQSRKGGASGG